MSDDMVRVPRKLVERAALTAAANACVTVAADLRAYLPWEPPAEQVAVLVTSGWDRDSAVGHLTWLHEYDGGWHLVREQTGE